jgi:hypothetical protein
VINFRYHVVSLTAVFLALAIGLVLGTAAANGPVQDDLNNQVNSLTKSNDQYRDQVDQLRQQMQSQDDFAAEVAPTLLAGRLSGRSVLVLSTARADSKDRDGVIRVLQQAGATVTGRIQITDKFLDPTNEPNLADLASKVVPEGVRVPNAGNGAADAIAVLASVLTTGGQAVPDSARTKVLTAFSSASMISIAGPPPTVAEGFVVITGVPGTDDAGIRRDSTLTAVVKQLDAATKVVLAAPQAGGSGNPVAAVRSDADLSKVISTVDSVSTGQGQVAVAMALAEQFAGRSGQYGTGDRATSLLPALPAKQ